MIWTIYDKYRGKLETDEHPLVAFKEKLCIHREDGPAVISSWDYDGDEAWFLDGKFYPTKEEHQMILKLKQL